MVVRGRGRFQRSGKELPRHMPPNGQIGEYRALAGLPRSQDALALLVRIGKAVAPLMARHGWRVPLLAEMRPSGRNLLGLNVNQGQKICLRLRPGVGGRYAGADADPVAEGLDAFLDYESVVQTMLHELTHIVRGPHDQVFWTTLQNLADEHDMLSRAGPAALSFTEPGHRLGEGGRTLGGGDPRTIPSRLVTGGGQNRLGGAGPSGDVPASVLAAAAAQRRTQQAGCCPDSAAAAREVELAAELDEQKNGVEAIVVSDSDSESDAEPGCDEPKHSTGAQVGDPYPSHLSEDYASGNPASDVEADDNVICLLPDPGTTKRPRWLDHKTPAQTIVVGDSDDASSSDEVSFIGQSHNNGASTWACAACTLRNKASALRCQACDAARPRMNVLGRSARQRLITSARPSLRPAARPIVDPKAWKCHKCGWIMANEFAHRWMCTSCEHIRTTS